MPSRSREPRLKADECKLRARRKICRQAGKKGGGRIKHPSPSHLILCTHLAGYINEEMTYEQYQPSLYLSVKAF